MAKYRANMTIPVDDYSYVIYRLYKEIYLKILMNDIFHLKSLFHLDDLEIQLNR